MLATEEPSRFAPLLRSLIDCDEYCVLADYRSHIDTQEQVANRFLAKSDWTRRAILTVARMGYFSSDRSIAEYCKLIWHAEPVKVGTPHP